MFRRRTVRTFVLEYFGEVSAVDHVAADIALNKMLVLVLHGRLYATARFKRRQGYGLHVLAEGA
jgi:hypothetical protein